MAKPIEENMAQYSISEKRVVTIFVIAALIVIMFVIAGGSYFVLGSGKTTTALPTTITTNTTEEADKQIVSLDAKGGFSPVYTVAKANKPTVIKVYTQNTFDCSSVVRIPSLGIQKNLPVSGITEIEIPAQEAGSKVSGTCSMGMYHFSINFI